MYEFIEGELAGKTPTQVVVNAGGVGYRFSVPLSTSEKLPARGRVKLFAHFYVREEIQRLYGFASEGEREVFEKLIAIPKVGPSMALAVLSGVSAAELRDAVVQQRPELLTRVKGVGAATAERIARELRREPPGAFETAVEAAASPDAEKERDVVAALLTLGYQRSSAERAARKALESLGPDAAVEALVPDALKRI